jgi:hypothetical protein
MYRAICAMGASLAVAGGALALSGCGSSSSPSSNHGGGASAAAPHTTTLASGQTLIEAADHVDQSSGYRMKASVKVSTGSGSVTENLSGIVAQHGDRGAYTARETVAGTTFDLQLRSANGTYYMSGVPGLSKISHGKRWVRIDVADAEQAQGLTGLQNPASSNPTEFLKYLRTVGSVSSAGPATVDGVRTTEYRATIDFDRYAKLVPSAQRAAATQTVATLEKLMGTHTLPVTAWVAPDHELRRMQISVPECIEGARVAIAMTVDLSDYGDVPSVSVPSASESYDLTPLVKSGASQLKNVAGGCSAG